MRVLQVVWDATATLRRMASDFVVTSDFANANEGHNRGPLVEDRVLP